MNHHKTSGPSFRSIDLLLGMAGALVGERITEALEIPLGIGTVFGALLGAAFLSIGWRQLQSR